MRAASSAASRAVKRWVVSSWAVLVLISGHPFHLQSPSGRPTGGRALILASHLATRPSFGGCAAWGARPRNGDLVTMGRRRQTRVNRPTRPTRPTRPIRIRRVRPLAPPSPTSTRRPRRPVPRRPELGPARRPAHRRPRGRRHLGRRRAARTRRLGRRAREHRRLVLGGVARQCHLVPRPRPVDRGGRRRRLDDAAAAAGFFVLITLYRWARRLAATERLRGRLVRLEPRRPPGASCRLPLGTASGRRPRPLHPPGPATPGVAAVIGVAARAARRARLRVRVRPDRRRGPGVRPVRGSAGGPTWLPAV